MSGISSPQKWQAIVVKPTIAPSEIKPWEGADATIWEIGDTKRSVGARRPILLQPASTAGYFTKVPEANVTMAVISVDGYSDSGKHSRSIQSMDALPVKSFRWHWRTMTNSLTETEAEMLWRESGHETRAEVGSEVLPTHFCTVWKKQARTVEKKGTNCTAVQMSPPSFHTTRSYKVILFILIDWFKNHQPRRSFAHNVKQRWIFKK